MDRSQNIDVVRMTAADLQNLLQNRQLTSFDLVKPSLAQIQNHNLKGLSLHAVISTSPEKIVLETATMLDEERAAGRLRGPLHGIPIILKDTVMTHSKFGMPTTVGSFALLNATANKSATIVERLEQEGMIILAKTNLNNPCGASTGSAVGVAAGFSPLAIGTEVDGSLVQPAARAGLYALKPIIGTTELGGIYAVSEDFDSLGGLTKSTKDLALLTNLIIKPETRAKLPSGGYVALFQQSFKNLRIGFVDPAQWRWPENVQPQHGKSLEEMQEGYLKVIELVENHEGHGVYPISLPPASAFLMDGQPAIITAIRYVFKSNVDAFLQSFEKSEFRTVEDLIRYNQDHADKELPPDHPEQGRLIDTIDNPVSKEIYERAFSQCRRVAREERIDKALSDNNIDILALPMDSPSPRLAAAAGYPIATVPIGTISYNGRPFGLAIIATGGREDLLFRFMSAFEAISDPRPVPPMLTG